MNDPLFGAGSKPGTVLGTIRQVHPVSDSGKPQLFCAALQNSCVGQFTVVAPVRRIFSDRIIKR
jgi:hypothetical protein